MPTEAYALCTSEHFTEKGYNFFISESELINLDFTDVWYNWACA